MSFAKEVFNKLNEIDCKDFVTEKGGSFKAKYISWSDAWRLLMNEYPESDYRFNEDRFIGNGTCEVSCTVVVREGEKSLERSMWLPVMGNSNASVSDPTTREISDARMRCLVKCIAMFGLGLYIYQGEDVPTDIKNYSDIEKRDYYNFINQKVGFSLWAMTKAVAEAASNDLYNSAPQGQKVEFKNTVDGLLTQGADEWNIFLDKVNAILVSEDAMEAKTLMDEMKLNKYEKTHLKERIGDDELKALTKLYKEAG